MYFSITNITYINNGAMLGLMIALAIIVDKFSKEK